jgi:hypothetical protein
MSSIELYFMGLLCHVYDGGADVVVVLDGPSSPAHFFRIVVPASDVDTVQTTAGFDAVHAGPSERAYILDGPLVIDGVVGTPRTPTRDFDTYVPKLTDVSSHRVLRPQISSRTTGGGVRAFIDHVPGVMDVLSWFPDKGKFIPPVGMWLDEQCFAQVIRIALATRGPVAVRNTATGEKVVLKTSALQMKFWNEPTLRGSTYNDFAEYYPALFSDSAVESLPHDSGSTVLCGKPTLVGGVECANSQYP